MIDLVLFELPRNIELLLIFDALFVLTNLHEDFLKRGNTHVVTATVHLLICSSIVEVAEELGEHWRKFLRQLDDVQVTFVNRAADSGLRSIII